MLKKLLTASVCAAALMSAPAMMGTSFVSKAYAADPQTTSASVALSALMSGPNAMSAEDAIASLQGDGYPASDVLSAALGANVSLDIALAGLVSAGYSAGDVVAAANAVATDDGSGPSIADVASALATVADTLATSDSADSQSYAAAINGEVQNTKLASAYPTTTTTSTTTTSGNNVDVDTGTSQNDSTSDTATEDSTPETAASSS